MPPRSGRSLSLVLLASMAMAPACRSALDGGAETSPGEARVVRRRVDDVFLLTGELHAVRSVSIVAPRGDGELQIRWLAEDGSDVKEGQRVLELDASQLIQRLEEKRLRLRQAEDGLESREREVAAETDRKRVGVEKARVEADKARIDASVPRELRPAVEWQRLQGVLREKGAALEKAGLEEEAFRTTARSDVEVLRRAREKARRDLEAAERSLASVSVIAPRSGFFLVGNAQQWNPEGPRKLQAGDTVWPGYPVASIPDPSEMEVSATLSEVDHGRISAGMQARSILDTYPDRVFDGRVEDVGAVAAEARRGPGPAGRTGFPVRISLARTDPVMRPGLSVRVEVVRGSWPQALVVPRRAVRFEGDAAVVARKGVAGSSPVRLTACTPIECVVEKGLAEGDRVLLF
jgi:HlyD family secretion protein